jgi:N-acetylated-alpha-linked acidic dipeptidase
MRASARLTRAPLPLATRQARDRILMQCDRALVRQDGLPRRPWYRHEIYTPGYYTGYAPETLPGVREAIEERRRDDARFRYRWRRGPLTEMAKQIYRSTGFLIR